MARVWNPPTSFLRSKRMTSGERQRANAASVRRLAQGNVSRRRRHLIRYFGGGGNSRPVPLLRRAAGGGGGFVRFGERGSRGAEG